MTPLKLVAVILIAALAYWLYQRKARATRLQQLATQQLDPDLLELMRQHMPLYERLPPDLQLRLQGLVNVFVNEKNFFGSDGLKITDAMRLAVAGNACLLILGRDDPRFPGSATILIYPDTIVAPQKHQDGAVVHEGASARLGESWRRGPVILSWADVLRGNQNPDDGQNVVLHEFAHKLDEENETMDGLPVLRDHADYAEWARVMTQEFAELTERVQRRNNRVIDSYASTSPVEFFAVVTEVFFEQGKTMQRKLPSLYEQLSKYYGVNTAAWKEYGHH